MARTKCTPKQSRFAAEYAIDLNASKAAKRAGYSPKSCHVIGYQLLQLPYVQKEISKNLEGREERTHITQDMILGELLRLATCDVRKAFDENGNLLPIHELPEDVARAISGIDTEEIYTGRGDERIQTGTVRKLKLWSKVESLRLLAQHLGMLVNRHVVEERKDGVYRAEFADGEPVHPPAPAGLPN